MSYTSVLTKRMPEKQKNGDFRVSVYVVSTDNDDSSVVLEKAYTVRYPKGWPIGDIEDKLQQLIKKDWDKLQDELVIYNSPSFDTVVSNLQAAVNAYTNL